MTAPPQRPLPRSYGLEFGRLPTGAHNAVTDVPGVAVGQVTIWEPSAGGFGPARTGVTAILPDGLGALYEQPMTASTAVLNGAGELTGSISLDDWATLETPILLTSTTSVGRGVDAVIDELLAAGVDAITAPVVGECDDSWLDDVRRRSVTVERARQAIRSAVDGPVAQGVVGAGTGMTTMGFKAGIGTASRVLPDLGGATVGVLLQCNFGGVDLLRIGGRLVGPALKRYSYEALPDDRGSCVGVVVTDLPLDARQLRRVARRVGLGLARVGSIAHHGSGDIFCAVSTTNRTVRDATGFHDLRLLADGSLNDVFTAVVDATEEAVVNALFAADTVTGVDGHVAPGLPVDRLLELLVQ